MLYGPTKSIPTGFAPNTVYSMLFVTDATTRRLAYIPAAVNTALGFDETAQPLLWTLAPVAMSGAYTDLSGCPTLGTASTQSSSAFDPAGAAAAVTWSTLSGKPSFASVATSGSYSDLSNKPSLSSATVTSVAASSSDGSIVISGSPITTSGTIGAVLRSRSFNTSPTVPLVTTAAAANGTQVSASRDAEVSYSINTSSTSTIAGASSVTAVLEICSTNSSTAGNWITVSTAGNSQTVSLAIALQVIQTLIQTMNAIVPAGYYRRIRYTVTGTGSCSFNSGVETLL